MQPTPFPAQRLRWEEEGQRSVASSRRSREQVERSLFFPTGFPPQTSAAFAVGRGGTTERCELSAQPGASGAQFVFPHRVPAANQRSVCGGKRRDNGALRALGAAGSKWSAVCFSPQGSRRKPAQRLRWEEEGQRSVASSRRSRERVERSLSRRQGGVPVSTGVWRRDQRAAAPDRHKTGNL